MSISSINNRLSKDVFLESFSYLSFKELVKISLVCRRWWRLADTPFLWRALCKRIRCKEESRDWKELFKVYWGKMFKGKVFASIEQSFSTEGDYTCLAMNERFLVRANDEGGVNHFISVWHREGSCSIELPTEHNRTINDVALGEGILVSGSDDHLIKVWDLQRGECLKSFIDDQEVTAVATWEDCILSGSWRVIKVWKRDQQQTSEPQKILTGHTSYVTTIARGECYFSSGDLDGNIQLWSKVSSKSEKMWKGSSEGISQLIFREETLISGDNKGRICVWNFEGNALFSLEEHSQKIVHFAVQGSILVSSSEDKTIRLWDLERRFCLQSFSCMYAHVHMQGSVLSFWDAEGLFIQHPFYHEKSENCGSMKGDLLVRGNLEGSLRVWRQKSHQFMELTGHKGGVNSIALGEGVVVSGSDDATVRVWDCDTGKCLLTLEEEQFVTAVAIYGEKIVSGSSGQVKIWDKSSGKCLQTLKGYEGDVTSVALGEDIVVTGDFEGDLLVRDLRHGGQYQLLKGHREEISSICLNDAVIVSGSVDRTVRVWERKTGKCLHQFHCASSVIAVSLEKEGLYSWDDKGKRELLSSAFSA